MLLTLRKLIYPQKCIVCGTILPLYDEEEYICPKCDKGVLRDNICPKCSKPYYIEGESCLYCKELVSTIHNIIALFPYQKGYKRSVLRWKYKGIRKYGKGFARLLAEEKTEIKDLDIQALIPVPISNKRYKDRGFNQAFDLASELGSQIEVPVYDILKRSRNTKPQSTCSKIERRKNISGTIRAERIPIEIIDKDEKINIAIIDDIYTTGSTIEECIKVLNEQDKLRIDKIYVIVVCVAI